MTSPYERLLKQFQQFNVGYQTENYYAMPFHHDWNNGYEPMTGAQAALLRTLSYMVCEPFDDTLSKAEATERIMQLQLIVG